MSLREENSTVTVNLHHKGWVMRSFDGLFVDNMSKLSNKQSIRV